MNQGRIVEKSFTESVKRSLENTLNFENHTLFEFYNYENENDMLPSALKLCVQENYILQTIIPYLRKEAELKSFTDEEQKRYNRKPSLLSYDKYGCIDYWWILLAINGYFNPSDFHDFQYLRIPSSEVIARVLDKEAFSNTQMGVLPY
jgi:hypothetical protein